MRILNVTQSYSPFFEFGGPPAKVRALSEGLARRGHAVTVLTADWGLERRLAAEKEQVGADHSPFGMRREENGVQAIYLPTWLKYRATSWNPAVKRYCRARLQNFDVVHIFGLYDLLGPKVAAACRARQLPYVVEPIGMFVPIVRNLVMKRMYHAVFGRSLFESAGAVIATSEQEADQLAAGGILREKIVIRRNGVEAPAEFPERGAFRSAQTIPQEARLILFLGRLSKKKSPDLLLQAFANLPAQMEESILHLAFAGPDESGMRARLEQMAGKLGLAPRVHFCGPLYGKSKWAAYRDADIFVLPSQNENFGNSAAEAVAAGTPVIVTRECGIAPLLADVAGLAVVHEAEAVSHALARVLSDRELHAGLAAGCRVVASQLGWEEPIRQIEHLYGNLAASRPAIGQSLGVG
jgi:glycosyltransferase involved in cell wall biosynthesis